MSLRSYTAFFPAKPVDETGAAAPASGVHTRGPVEETLNNAALELPVQDHEREALRHACQVTLERLGPLLGLTSGLPLLCWEDHVTLSSLYRETDELIRFEQFDAMARLLANRGVPSLALQRHLSTVAAELPPVARSGRRTKLHQELTCYSIRLEHAAHEFRSIRREMIEDDAWHGFLDETRLGDALLSEAHARRSSVHPLSDEDRSCLRQCAELLLCAACDAARGAPSAVERTLERLSRGSRVPTTVRLVLPAIAGRAKKMAERASSPQLP